MDDLRRQRVLRQHVKTDQLMGLTAVPVGQAPPAVSEAPAPATTRPAVGSARAQPAADAPVPTTAPPIAPRTRLEAMDRDTRLRVLQQIDEQEVRGCTDCELHQYRQQTVFGEGAPDAPVLFIGEGPGQNEDEQGRPFVGRAGDLLTKMIRAMGYERDQIYIANVVKCRPPNNRTPKPQEVEACWQYLRRQIETIQPKVIVTLGGPAAKMILNTKEGITRLRGIWHSYDAVEPPIPVMPTFHPAYLLRSYTKENRARVWSDLQAVMDKVNAST